MSDVSIQSIERLLRPDLRGREPYGAPQLDVPVRLNTNENPHPPSPGLVADLAASVADAARTMNRYPDRDAVALRADLASYLSRTTALTLTTDQIWAANGSNEVLQQLLQAFGGPGRTAIGFEPTYSMHRIICLGTGTSYVPVPRSPGFGLDVATAVAAAREHRPDVVFLCSPNNPTGTAVEPEVIEAVYAATTGLVVVDEAYAEFSAKPSAVGLLDGRERLVVTRTMSKAFAFAAARLGYLAADPALIDALRLVRLPYHLSVLSQAAARAALAHAEELLATVEDVRKQRDRLVEELGRLGLDVTESDANFVLVGGFADEAATWARLLDRGVLVRDIGIPGRLGVTAGTETETTAFLEALAEGEGIRWSRSAVVARATKESDVHVEIDLDGSGRTEIETGVPFFDHMLAQLGRHSGMNLVVRTKGDLDVDAHHTVEDTALALGQALREALGDKAGIRRFGDALVPLDETLVQAAVDLSGRPYVVHEEPDLVELIGSYDTTLTRHIWESLAASAQICLHVRVISGRNAHHVVEAQFKAVARALRDAVALDGRVDGVPSTKGTL